MNPIMKKVDKFFFRYFSTVLLLSFVTVVLIKLSLMQTNHMFSFGATFVTALFGMTSLLYARARSVTEPSEISIRASIADESLKASFIAIIGFGVTSYIYIALAESYSAYTGPLRVWTDFNPDLVPALTSLICTLVFVVPTVVKVGYVVETTIKNIDSGA